AGTWAVAVAITGSDSSAFSCTEPARARTAGKRQSLGERIAIIVCIDLWGGCSNRRNDRQDGFRNSWRRRHELLQRGFRSFTPVNRLWHLLSAATTSAHFLCSGG